MEARRSEGEKIDLGLYSRLTSLLCRMLELVGIRRVTKPLDPLSDLAKAFEGYAGNPIDDDGDKCQRHFKLFCLAPTLAAEDCFWRNST
jgi:hypothetical protein